MLALRRPLAIVRKWQQTHFGSPLAALAWMRARQADRPSFASLDELMRWTYRTKPDTVRPSAVVRMMGVAMQIKASEEAEPPRPINPDVEAKPREWDALAQIGFVKRYVEGLPAMDHCHFVAKHALPTERKRARRVLRDLLVPLLDIAVRPRFPVYLAVCAHYDCRSSEQREAVVKHITRKLWSLHPPRLGERNRNRYYRVRQDARELMSQVENLLKNLATRAEENAHAYFQERGVIT